MQRALQTANRHIQTLTECNKTTNTEEEEQRCTDNVSHVRVTADSASKNSLQEVKQRSDQFFNELRLARGNILGEKYLQWGDAKLRDHSQLEEVSVRGERVQPSK